jgi:hypothetical protein
MASSSGRSKFTWQELAELNERHTIHVAVRGKVRLSKIIAILEVHMVSIGL